MDSEPSKFDSRMEVAKCPCGSTEVSREVVRSRDAGSGEYFTFVKCLRCGIERCSPRPRAENMAAYYGSTYAAHAVRPYSLTDRVKNLVYRTFWADQNTLGLLRPLLRLALFPIRGRGLLAFRPPAGRLVFEFGAASGNNLVVFRAAGWSVTGCEPSVAACASAAQRGIQLEQGSAEEAHLTAGAYSCILINHVLEHVHDPKCVLHKCRAALTPDGVLVIGLPNHDGWAARYFRGAWPGYDAPRHLWGFSAAAIAALLAEQGFRIEHIYHEATGRWAWMSSFEGRNSAEPVPLWRRRLARQFSLLALPLGVLAATVGHGDFIKVIARRA